MEVIAGDELHAMVLARRGLLKRSLEGHLGHIAFRSRRIIAVYIYARDLNLMALGKRLRRTWA